MSKTLKLIIIGMIVLLMLGGLGIFANDVRRQGSPPATRDAEDPCPDKLLTSFEEDQSMAEVLTKTADTLVEALQKATSTCFLTATDVPIQQILPQIGVLSNLRYLNLADDSIVVLPGEIGQLTRLRIVNLNDNNISQLPSTFFDLVGLTDLALVRNRIEDLPPGITRLIHLKTLLLDGNPIPTSTVDRIRTELPNTNVSF